MADTTNKTPVKSGFKSSEFWILLVAILSIVLPPFLGYAQQQVWGSILIAVLAVVYSIVRMMMKAEKSGVIDIVPLELETTIDQANEVLGAALENLQKPDAKEPAK